MTLIAAATDVARVFMELGAAVLGLAVLGIEAVFWQNEPTDGGEGPAILSMVRPG
jgi:hypothetical protein